MYQNQFGAGDDSGDVVHWRPRGSTSGRWFYQKLKQWPQVGVGGGFMETPSPLVLEDVEHLVQPWGEEKVDQHDVACRACPHKTVLAGSNVQRCTEYTCNYTTQHKPVDAWMPHLLRQRRLNACRFEAKQQEDWAKLLADRDCLVLDVTTNSQKKVFKHPDLPLDNNPTRKLTRTAEHTVTDTQPKSHNNEQTRLTTPTKIEPSRISHWAQQKQKKQEQKYREAQYQKDRFGKICFNDIGTGFDREKCETEDTLTEEHECHPGIELLVGPPPRDIMAPRQLMLRQKCQDGNFRAPDPPQGTGCPSDVIPTSLRCYTPPPSKGAAGAKSQHKQAKPKVADCDQFRFRSTKSATDNIGSSCSFPLDSKNTDRHRAVRRHFVSVHADTCFWRHTVTPTYR